MFNSLVMYVCLVWFGLVAIVCICLGGPQFISTITNNILYILLLLLKLLVVYFSLNDFCGFLHRRQLETVAIHTIHITFHYNTKDLYEFIWNESTTTRTTTNPMEHACMCLLLMIRCRFIWCCCFSNF